MRHPRREAGPQSHGTPPEFAGLPKECHHADPRGPWRPSSGTSAGCSPIWKDSYVHPHRLRRGRLAGIASSRASPSRRPVVAQAPPVNLGTAEPVRRPRRLDRHQHRALGPQRRPRPLARAPRSPASGFPPSSTARPTPTTPSPPGAGRSHHRLQRRRRPARPPGNDLTGTDLGNRTLKAGAYRFATSAQLTGALTLDAAGRPQRAVRLRDRLDADDRVGQLGRPAQRRQRRATSTGRSAAPRRSAPRPPSRAT